MGAFIVSHIPIVRQVFATVNTLIHESGHAIAALLTSGKVYSVSLFLNSEGLAQTGTRSWLSKFIVSYAGYTFSSAIAFISFYFISTGRTAVIFYGLFTLAIINLLFWIRNVYGILWLFGFLGFCLYIEYNQLSALKEHFTLFVACIVLIQSVSTSFAVLYLSLIQPSRAGDATNLAKLTFIPATLWGFVFFGQSIVVLYYVFTLFII
ncbi:M50 family metallopeptidase [Desertibacillus haloalkaliphilus]|uniref:M50 family metallopeptidase n=1 Tax=Desertibacillus haloalkaliphilus TaxID=1328930 RepID=UPI001C253237|nr:M50 family metallopeptidase [Desertibacillus haloalkaliphilus]MBU8907639.1 M50 family metallopeptidase [Desertibacillus haloalkaliphilus]